MLTETPSDNNYKLKSKPINDNLSNVLSIHEVLYQVSHEEEILCGERMIFNDGGFTAKIHFLGYSIVVLSVDVPTNFFDNFLPQKTYKKPVMVSLIYDEVLTSGLYTKREDNEYRLSTSRIYLNNSTTQNTSHEFTPIDDSILDSRLKHFRQIDMGLNILGIQSIEGSDDYSKTSLSIVTHDEINSSIQRSPTFQLNTFVSCEFFEQLMDPQNQDWWKQLIEESNHPVRIIG